MRRSFASVAVALLAVVVLVIPAAAAGRAASPFGVIAGVVADAQGIPQMGAAVALVSADGRTLQRVYSNDRGIFLLEHLLPGLYSLRVTLASFLPVLKENILIEPGIRSFLSINLASLFDTADLVRGRRRVPVSDDDWTWVLRTSGANRPVLRYLPAAKSGGAGMPTEREPVDHAVLQFSGGAGRSSSAGSEADFNTSFTLANSPFRNTSLLLSGNLGYERQTPATAFHGALRRQLSNGSTPEVSVTLRQVFLPTAYFGRGAGREDNLQSLTLAAGDRFRMAGSVRLEYGFLFDSISFLDRLNSFSPYGRVIFETSPSAAVQLSYSEGAPHLRQPGSDSLGEVASQLSVFPRLSMRNGSPVMQRGRHLEASYQRKLGEATVVQAGVFHDVIRNLALNTSLRGEPPPDFLPDVFTQQYSFNSGNHRTTGVRAALQQQLSEHVQATFAYSYSGVLAPERRVLYTQDADELRSILTMQRRHALAAKVGANVPVTKTRLFAAYKWVLGTAVSPGDIYDDSLAQAEPNLSLLVRQPLPSFAVLPGRIEALADFRNLLAKGYIPIMTADGKRLLLVQNVRSFRGGFSFIF